MGPVQQRVPAGLPWNFYAAAGTLWTAGWLSGATCLSVAFLDGPALGGGGGWTTVGAGRAGELLNALGLWKEAVWEGHLGPEVIIWGPREGINTHTHTHTPQDSLPWHDITTF